MATSYSFRFGGGGGGSLDLPLIPWEGPNYFSQFAKADAAGWGDPSFFPIGVFLSDWRDAAELAAIGVNHYIGIFGGGTGQEPFDEAEAAGMQVVAQFDDFSSGFVGSHPAVVGWLCHDEPDNNIPIATYETDVDAVRAYDDGRFIHTNFALGVLRTHWWEEDVGGGLIAMDTAMSLPDVSGADHYYYTSPDVRSNSDDPFGDCSNPAPNWPGPACGSESAWTQRSASYGWIVDQLRTFQTGTTKPQYITVETKLPFLEFLPGKSIILYEEIEGAVFSALAHECRGIMYFQHNGTYDASAPAIDPNTGVAPITNTMSLVDCEAGIRTYIGDMNARIAALAPVLNTQSYVFDFGAANVDTMLKAKDGYAYIFASQGFNSSNGSKTFTLTGSGITGTDVEVVDESRSLTVSGGQFTDTFASEYSHHVYKVAI